MNFEFSLWLGLYFLIGVLLLITGRILVKLFYTDKRSDFVKTTLAALEEDKSPQEKRREFFKNLVTGSLILVVWPVAFVVLLNELTGKSDKAYAIDDEPKFTSEKKYLIEIVNPHEVETASKIVDPKGRVPELPFGHLNRGWTDLRRQMKPGDVMWSFKTKGYQANTRGAFKGPQYEFPRKIVQGYAIVRSGKIVGEFLTQWD